VALNKNRKYYKDRLNELKGAYESNGSDAVDRDKTKYLYPHGRNLDNTISKSDGTRKDEYILNNTVLLAVRAAVAGIFAGGTSPLEKWFRLADEDKELNETTRVSEFYQKSTDLILLDMSKSNFYSIAQLVIKDLLTYAISFVMIDMDTDRVFNFTHVPNGQYYIDVDSKGEVSAVYRVFQLRARNVIAEYGEENVSQNVSDKMKGQQTGGGLVNIFQAIEKNEGRDITKEDNLNMPWTSVTYELDDNVKNEKPLRLSGYETKPFAVPRWSVSSGNIYGDGPGDLALGDAKQLQYLVGLLMNAIEKEIKPAILAPEGVNVNTGPDEITRVDSISSTGRPPVIPLYQVSPDISKLVALIIDIQERIRKAFFSDLFFTQGEADPRETATLTIAKQKELLRLLGPAIQRMNPEWLSPVIQRCFDIEFRLVRLPDIPNELRDRDIKIEIISSLTKAQELSIVTPIQEMIATIGQASQVWPEAIDKLDIDQAIDEIERVFGLPAGVVRKDEVVAEIRALKAQQALQAQEALQTQQAIEGAQQLSQTDLTGDNALNAVLNQGGTP
jgi:hypothetical protein